MSLSEVEVRKLKPEAKQYKRYDADGLFIIVMPEGSKLWRFRYQFEGREKGISFGKWPGINLNAARKRRDEALAALALGEDPMAQKVAKAQSYENTFERVAQAWLAMYRKKELAEHTFAQTKHQIERHLIPAIGANKPIGSLTSPQTFKALELIEEKVSIDMMHRCKKHLRRIVQFALSRGLIKIDITHPLEDKKALPEHKVEGLKGLTDPDEVGALLRSIEGYQGHGVSTLALKIMPHVALRTIELRRAEWSWVKWDQKEWHFPEHVMKMRRAHIVPLSRQVLELLRQLHKMTGDGRLMFPQTFQPNVYISANCINSMLRNMGYDTETQHCGHGFRKTFSTLLNENWKRFGARSEWVEMQLAHWEGGVRGIYNKAQYLDDRHEMMQKWSDYLDELRAKKPQYPTRAAADSGMMSAS